MEEFSFDFGETFDHILSFIKSFHPEFLKIGSWTSNITYCSSKYLIMEQVILGSDKS